MSKESNRIASCRACRGVFAADKVKRADRTSASADATKKNAPFAKLPRVPSAVTVGVLPSGTLLGEADCTGLDPEAVYVYGGNRRLSVTRAVHESTRSESEGERVEGRARRPPQRASTVAPTVTAHWKANQHCT